MERTCYLRVRNGRHGGDVSRGRIDIMLRRRWHGRWSIGTIVIRLILVYPFPVICFRIDKKVECVQLVS